MKDSLDNEKKYTYLSETKYEWLDRGDGKMLYGMKEIIVTNKPYTVEEIGKEFGGKWRKL